MGFFRKILMCVAFFASTISGASSADVMLSEVLYDAVGIDTGQECIELWNSGNDSVDLSGYYLTSASSGYSFPVFTLGSGGTVVIRWNTNGINSASTLYAYSVASMRNTSDYIALFTDGTKNKQIVDYLRYHNGASVEATTWESAAVAAGLWTKGDFIRTAPAGYSLSLKAGTPGSSASDYYAEPLPDLGKPPGITTPEPVSALLVAIGSIVVLRKYLFRSA